MKAGTRAGEAHVLLSCGLNSTVDFSNHSSAASDFSSALTASPNALPSRIVLQRPPEARASGDK